LTYNTFLDDIPGYGDEKRILTGEIAGYKLAVKEIDDDMKP
jgi:hypothetical protein